MPEARKRLGEARGPILRIWRPFWTHFGPFSSNQGQTAYLRPEHCDIATVETSETSTDICPVSAADICPVSTEDICPVSAADVLGGDENDFDPFLHLKCSKWNSSGGARRNGGRDVETEPHQPRVMARITAVKQTPSN